jgi:hypothetical protein
MWSYAMPTKQEFEALLARSLAARRRSREIQQELEAQSVQQENRLLAAHTCAEGRALVEESRRLRWARQVLREERDAIVVEAQPAFSSPGSSTSR